MCDAIMKELGPASTYAISTLMVLDSGKPVGGLEVER